MENQTQPNQSIENNSQLIQESQKPLEPQPAEPRMFKLKVGDKEEELPEQELAELVKAGRNAYLPQKEAQELKQILEQLKSNPRKVLADPKMGIDLYKLAEETLLEKIQQDMLTPEQKKIQDYEKRFKEIEEKEKEQNAKKDQEALAQAEALWMQEYDKLFHEALASSSLPKTPRTIKRMAEVAAVKLDKGEEIDAKTLAGVVREDYLAELKDLLGASDEDALLQLLGDEIGNKIRKADLKKLKGRASIGNSTVSSLQPSKVQANRLNASEWRERMDKIKQGFE